MKNKLLALTLCLLTLTGCSLADPELGEAALPSSLTEESDALVGVVITREHLDLFDADTFVQDNAATLLAGKNPDGNAQSYYKKLYAKPEQDGRVEFDLPDSISYFSYEYDHPAGRTTAITNNGIYGGGSHIKSTDQGEEIELTGTVYVPARSGIISYFFNPVYQEPDGDVYLLPGQGSSLSGDNGEGMSFTHSMSNSVTRTENGKRETRKCRLSITVEVMEPPQSIRLLQMDKTGTLLSTLSWTPGQVPPELTLHRDCAWAVAEQVKSGTVARALLNFGDKSMESFYREGDLIKVQTTSLNWP